MAEVLPATRFLVPILTTLRKLGGSATIQEMYEHTTTDMALSDKQLAVPHDPERGNQTEVAYRMAWARTYLKWAGLIDNSQRGIWSLTRAGLKAEKLNEGQIVQIMRERRASAGTNEKPADVNGRETEDTGEEEREAWRATLIALLKAMPPDQFERLCQRILRESGFVEVNVTGRSGDGGIDGTGILRIQGIVSFHVLFQCKRYDGTVAAREIRDFRGAMVGRTDKGLFLTTGLVFP